MNPDPMPIASKVKRTSRAPRFSCSQPCSTKRDVTDLLSQASTSDGGDHVVDSAVCNICKQTITQGIEIKSLQCCICNNSYYHGECLKISDSLLPHLHVVADIGGWCCTLCRTMKKVAARKVTKPAAADPDPVITEFRKDLEVIKTQMSTISARLEAFPPLPPPAAGPTLFANSIVQPSQHSSTDKVFRSAVLTTVHHEMKTINQRSSNVVVSGLKPNDALADEDLFKELCYAHLDCDVEVIKTSRLGKAQDGRTRPLLVTLASHADASKLLTMAKTLRSSSDPVVRREVFLNKHLTAAESKTAYEARVARRSRQPQASTSSFGSLINPRGSIPSKPSDDVMDLRVSTDSVPASI